MGADDMLSPAPPPKTFLARYHVLSKLAGVRVSPFVLGGMSIGAKWSSTMGSNLKPEDSYELLDAFYEAGGNFIDTANNYHDEDSEKWIGDWMESRQNRDSIVLSTKFTSNYRMWELGKGGPSVNYGGNHRKSLHISVRDSLKKLKTDYIDLLFVHWWDWSTSIPELMDSLHSLVQQGKVLYLGASDLPAWVVATANAYAIHNAKTPFSVYQGPWNVLDRGLELEIVPLCRHYGMAIMPWQAMGGGKFKTEAEIEARKKDGKPLRTFFGPLSDSERAMSAALDKVASEIQTSNGPKSTRPSVTAIALAWVMHKAPYVVPLVGGASISQLKQNIEAISIRLSDDQMEYLESVSLKTRSMIYNLIDQPTVTGKSTMVDAMAPVAWVLDPQPISKTWVEPKTEENGGNSL